MALDSTMALIAVAPGSFTFSIELARQLMQIIDRAPREWAIRLSPEAFEMLDGRRGPLPGATSLASVLDGRWLVSADHETHKLVSCLDRLAKCGGNFYGELEAAGVILVRATVEPTLNGGSFCQVRLRQSGELVVVGKTSEDMLAGDPDAGLRLTREVTWLRGLSRSAGALFAPLLATQANGLGYTARFLHSYTLSERLFHGTLDADAAVAMLGETLSSLRRDLYGMPCKAAAEDTYSDKLTRRLHRLTSASGDATMLKELMACERLVINGTECLGLPGLIASGLERRLDRLNGLLPREQAHGDLILDDIVCPRQDRCYLVDPSGTGSSRVYDVGKLGLSLCSYYEFFKYDRFTIDRDLSTSIPSINITIGMDEVRRTYDQIAMALPTLLRDTGVFDARNCLSGEDFLLLNGAQNLALPMFHSLRHHKHERALAFMTMGILRLNQYLNMMNRAVPTTLDTVIDNLGAELALVG